MYMLNLICVVKYQSDNCSFLLFEGLYSIELVQCWLFWVFVHSNMIRDSKRVNVLMTIGKGWNVHLNTVNLNLLYINKTFWGCCCWFLFMIFKIKYVCLYLAVIDHIPRCIILQNFFFWHIPWQLRNYFWNQNYHKKIKSDIKYTLGHAYV